MNNITDELKEINEVEFQSKCLKLAEKFSLFDRVPTCEIALLGQENRRLPPPQDQIWEYTKTLLHLGGMILHFEDSNKKKKKKKVYRYYRAMTPHYRAYSIQSKMAIECLYIQAQVQCLLTLQIQHLLFERFYNKYGGPGGNIPVDLHQEHRNKETRHWIKSLQSNTDPRSVIRSSILSEPLQQITLNLDGQFHIQKKNKRTKPSIDTQKL